MPKMRADGPAVRLYGSSEEKATVAELEREVQAMRALFETKKQAAEPDASAQPSKLDLSGRMNNSVRSIETEPTSSPDVRGTGWTPTPFQAPAAETSLRQDWSTSAFSMNSDVIDRGMVSMEVATQLFRTYMSDLYQHYPVVPFPRDASPEEIRRTQPTLFLAVIAAAAAKTDPHLYSALNSEVLSAYAHRTVIHSEKSLELVKAMIVSVVWQVFTTQILRIHSYGRNNGYGHWNRDESQSLKKPTRFGFQQTISQFSQFFASR
ncbi:hypothetical protein LAWI1_G002652 [Lachnellula willkommii]|uniref:Transcription factor domain-containing protein n=1 Tax=Lachnellula willkommii TaxID=215461 RepID=A0A559MH94_9HELO|nr:hypothetical protein LAWI1_G002652 [Lachnellula willkommii]